MFYGFIGSCERDEHSRQAKQQEEKPNEYGGKVAQLQAAENGENSIRRSANDSVGHAPDNLIKEESGAGGAGKSLVVEGVVGVPSGIGSDGAEEALFNGDADRAPDRHLTTHKERLKSVLGVKEATAIVNRAAGGETTHSRQHKGKQKVCFFKSAFVYRFD